MDCTMDVSSVLMPVTFMERMVYSFGTLALLRFNKLGSMEVTFDVSFCAKEAEASSTKRAVRKEAIFLCMMINSNDKAIGEKQFGGAN